MIAFRWRGGDISRIEAFSDGVFAFALTLLVVSLEVPRSVGELVDTMSGFVAFAACFAILLWIWFEHYRFFRKYGLSDGWTIVLNGLLLFVVLFYVYPLKFMFTMLSGLFFGLGGRLDRPPTIGDVHLVLTIYGLGFVAVFTVFSLLHWRALTRADQLELNPVERYDTTVALRAHVLSAAVGLCSIALVQFLPQYPGIAGFIYCLLGPIHGFHGHRSGRRRPRTAEAVDGEDDSGPEG